MQDQWSDLTIVTSCHRYGKYLPEWTKSILSNTVRVGRVCMFSHGTVEDFTACEDAIKEFKKAGIATRHEHSATQLDYGSARNRAVAMAVSPWVMHLDADDLLMSHAIKEFRILSESCDVIQAGYERSGNIAAGPARRARVYQGADGLAALDLPAICSGNSPFRKTLWDRSPYRSDMLGAWDTALWIGFSRLGARFRPTIRAAFYYRQHHDSVFNERRRVNGWARAHTSAMLKALRRNYEGVDIIVPLSKRLSAERQRNWTRVRAHYAEHHPDWRIIEGLCDHKDWIKGRAVEDATGAARGEIVVIADSDCIVHPDKLRDAVAKVKEGAPWAMPHTMVHRAKDALTHVICGQHPSTLPMIPAMVQCDRVPHVTVPGGGIVVVKRVNYDAVGGIPQVFHGWGGEDKAFAIICETALGPCTQGDGILVHLWHEHQQDKVLPNGNLGVLKKIGYAAQHGKDSLIALTSTFPNGAARPTTSLRPAPGLYHKASVREVRQFDQRTIAERRERLQAKRRRMP